MVLKTIQRSPNDDSVNVDIGLQDDPSPEQVKENELLRVKAQREKEKKYGEWAESVLAGKTNLSLIDWLSNNRSKRSPR